MEQRNRNAQERPHAAFAMNTQNPERFAAIRTVQQAGVANSATDVRFHGATRAGLDIPVVGGRADHLHAQLVAENPGIGKEGLTAGEGVQIGAANTDAVDSNESFSGSGLDQGRGLFLKLARLLKHNLTHWFDRSTPPNELG
jgi:hypothetical protein